MENDSWNSFIKQVLVYEWRREGNCTYRAWSEIARDASSLAEGIQSHCQSVCAESGLVLEQTNCNVSLGQGTPTGYITVQLEFVYPSAINQEGGDDFVVERFTRVPEAGAQSSDGRYSWELAESDCPDYGG